MRRMDWAAEQMDAADEAGAGDGASPLIHVFDRPYSQLAGGAMMRTRYSRGLTLIGVVALGALVAVPSASPSGSRDYVIDASVLPVAGEDGTYVCTTTIHDAAAHQVLASPKVRFRRGGSVEKARLSDVPEPGMTLEVSVAVSDTGDAKYEARLMRPGVAQLVTRVTFALTPRE